MVGALSATSALADESAPEVTDQAPKKKKKKKKLDFAGRVFVRSALVDTEGAPDTTAQTSLQSARAKADYRSHDLRAELELEFASKAKVKNAYVQLRVLDDAPRIDVRAGNFKMPFSAIQMASIWTLPMADRGLLDNVLVKRMQIAGRAVGGMVAVELGGPLKPELRAGMFQGTDDAGNALAVGSADGYAHDAVVRATIEPFKGLELGAAGSERAGALLVAVPIVIRHAYAGELDATADVALGPGQLRAWAEGMVGTSWLTGGTDMAHVLTRFVEARAIVAYRLGGGERWARYVELYGLSGVLDPDRITRNDRVFENTAGITYGASEVWRVQAEAEFWRLGSAAPIGIAEFALGPIDSTTLLVQLGARL